MDSYDPERAIQNLTDELIGAGEVIRADRMLIAEAAAQVTTRLELMRVNARLDAPRDPASTPDRVREAPAGAAPDA